MTDPDTVRLAHQIKRIAGQVAGLGDRMAAVERTEQLSQSSVPDKDGNDMDVSSALRAGLDGLDKAADALAKAVDVEATVDGKVTVFYQETQPTDAGVGDYWVKTSNNTAFKYDGDYWQAAESGIAQALIAAQNAKVTADGKINTFWTDDPPENKAYGDIWYKKSDRSKPFWWDGNEWLDIHDGYIDVAQSRADDAHSKATSAQSTANSAYSEARYGTVDANRISANTLEAISAYLGSVHAGTITGSTLETSSGGVRIGYDRNGVRDDRQIVLGTTYLLDDGNFFQISSNRSTVTFSTANSALSMHTVSGNLPWIGNPLYHGTGIKYSTGTQGAFVVAHNGTSAARIHALSFEQSSSAAVKKYIGDLPTDPLTTVKAAPSKRWKYRAAHATDSTSWHVGPMAEDLPDEVTHTDDDGEMSVDIGSMVGLLWAAVNELNEKVDGLVGKVPA